MTKAIQAHVETKVGHVAVVSFTNIYGQQFREIRCCVRSCQYRSHARSQSTAEAEGLATVHNGYH